MKESIVLRMAIGQTVPRLLDIDTNMAEACRLGKEAAGEGARLLVLPEGCLTGNALSSPTQQATLPVDPAAFADLQSVARDGGITICAGFATPYGDSFNIVHAIIEPGQVRFQRKAFRASTEPAFLAPWPDPVRTAFSVTGVRVVITICSEFGAPGVMASVASVAPQLILHPSAGRMPDAEVIRDEAAPLTDAAAAFSANCSQVVRGAAKNVAKHGIARAGSNPIGFDGEIWWPGNSYAVAADGRIVLEIPGENHADRMNASFKVGDIILECAT